MEVVQRWRIGRAEGCEIRITDDEYVSDLHALIFRDGLGRVWIRDGGSMNGTYVVRGGGGQPAQVIGPTLIQPGDTVIVGRTSIPWSRT